MHTYVYLHFHSLHYDTFFILRKRNSNVFLSFLFFHFNVVSAASIHIWRYLFCCSIFRCIKSIFPLPSYISISILIALEGNKCFQSNIFGGIRAKTFWYFSVVFFLHSHKLFSELIFPFLLAVSIFFGLFRFNQH